MNRVSESVASALSCIASECGASLRIERTDTGSWEVFTPGDTPCICDNLDDAAECVREFLRSNRGRKYR